MIKLKSGVHASDFKVRGRGSRSARQKGLTFQRVFSTKGKAPLDDVEWERRTAEITNDSGNVIIGQEDVEVPKNWSPLATKIAVSKYFYGDIAHGTNPFEGGRENSVRQLITPRSILIT